MYLTPSAELITVRVVDSVEGMHQNKDDIRHTAVESERDSIKSLSSLACSLVVSIKSPCQIRLRTFYIAGNFIGTLIP